MARRKRASMREGPLADLFRSTTREEEEQPTQQQPAPEAPSEDETRVFDREGGTPSPPPPEPPQVHEEPEPEPEPAPPDPERVRAYRVDDIQEIPHAKERLSRIFAEEHDVEGPAYGREEPGLSNYHGPPRPHMPVIRVVGVGGAGVNAINRMIEAQVPGVEFMAINTDLQSLQQSTADVTVHLGSGVAGGLPGAGQDQAPPQGLGHGVRHRRRGRGHGYRRRPGDRAARAGCRRIDGRDRHEAVSVRGNSSQLPGRPGDRGAQRRG